MSAIKAVKYLKKDCGVSNSSFTLDESSDNVKTLSETIATKSALKEKEINASVEVKTQLYKRRWYILLLFCFLLMLQGGFWNRWGPIAESSEKAFGWSDANIALFANWGPIGNVIATFLFVWLIDVKGLRPACLLASFMVALGAALRCISDHPPYITWTVNIAQCLNGMAGPVTQGAPPVLSAVWFPVNERTTATALQSISLYVGVGLSFLIGPAIVKQETIKDNNTNYLAGNSMNFTLTDNTTNKVDSNEIQLLRDDIMLLLYGEAVVTALAFLLLLLYFPSKPKLPPTKSAAVEKVKFKQSFKQLARNGKFWWICLTYGLTIGVFNCWVGILDVVVKPYGFSETKAGWLGFYALLGGCCSSLTVSRFADVFSKHIKLFLLLLYFGASAMMVWFTLLIQGIIPSTTGQLYSSIIIFQMSVLSTAPLYYELACETTYPVAQGITSLVLTMVMNISGGIFLVIQMIPDIGTRWTNWGFLGAMVVCIPILVLFKEQYNRFAADESEKTEAELKKT